MRVRAYDDGVIYGTDDGLPMCPVLDPMTFDELSELYRVEMKSNAVTQARKDLFRAMAGLLTSLRQEYDRQMALDPESIMCEGAEQRRKSAERLVKDVMRLRTQKICGMALRGATGSKNTLDNLTDEEREYYAQVLEISKTRRHPNRSLKDLSLPHLRPRRRPWPRTCRRCSTMNRSPTISTGSPRSPSTNLSSQPAFRNLHRYPSLRRRCLSQRPTPTFPDLTDNPPNWSPS